MINGKESKYQHILDVAYQLFFENGYSNTKMIDIARESGIGKGTIYEYFESKESLFYEIIKTKMIPLYSEMYTLIENDKSCLEQLRDIIKFEVHTCSKHGNNKDILSYLLINSEFFHNKNLVAALQEMIKMKFEMIHSVIQRGMQTGEFTNIDPFMASISVVGALNYYLCFNYDFIATSQFFGLKKNKEQWNEDEFIEFILMGLAKK